MEFGQQLRKAREARSLSLEQAAQATHIRVHYLKALEEGRIETLPSMAQVRGFLRSYAGYLRLDAQPLLDALDGIPLPDLQPPSSEASEAPQKAPETPAEVIFAELGQKLRTQRETLGLSIDDVESHTHIRAHYVKALERGDQAGLPSPVQGRGMLNNYAHFLGLDPDSLLLQFADGLQAQLVAKKSVEVERKPAAKAAEPGGPSPLRRLFSSDLLLGSILVILLVVFTAWATLRISALSSGKELTPTAPSIAEVLAPSPSATLPVTPSPTIEPLLPSTELAVATAVGIPEEAVPIGETEVPTATETLAAETSAPSFSTGAIQIMVVAKERAWMRVSVDGELAFEGRVIPGSAYPFAGNERIDLLTGNAAGLQVFFNQQDLGVLGFFAEVVERIFTVQGMQTPTPSVPNTATPAPTETPTPLGTSPATPTGTPDGTPDGTPAGTPDASPTSTPAP
jgi:cytoskeletal protein RodZ